MSTQKKSTVKEALKVMREGIENDRDEKSPKKEFDIQKAAELMSKGQKADNN